MLNNQENYKAFLFDLNGTMIDDMPYHIKAWHQILLEHDPSLSYERVKAECYGKNEELLERIFPGHFSDNEKRQMTDAKEKRYKEVFKSELRLISGLHEFLDNSHRAGIKIGIGTAAIIGNVDFVLDGVQIRQYFDAIVSADDVDESKPHPETFLTCAQLLGVDPVDCLVFEDTPKGAESALNAGINCVIITTLHRREEFSNNENVIGFISTFDDPFIKNLIKWKEHI
jgi:beta-phosphoglucomutase family hydrolase